MAKGMSTALNIIVTIIVLLIIALALISFFGVKVGDMGNQISSWLTLTSNAPNADSCNVANTECSLFKGCQLCKKNGDKYEPCPPGDITTTTINCVCAKLGTC